MPNVRVSEFFRYLRPEVFNLNSTTNDALKEVSLYGGITFYIYIEYGEVDSFITVGYALCQRDEKFNIRFGRENAQNRSPKLLIPYNGTDPIIETIQKYLIKHEDIITNSEKKLLRQMLSIQKNNAKLTDKINEIINKIKINN